MSDSRRCGQCFPSRGRQATARYNNNADRESGRRRPRGRQISRCRGRGTRPRPRAHPRAAPRFSPPPRCGQRHCAHRWYATRHQRASAPGSSGASAENAYPPPRRRTGCIPPGYAWAARRQRAADPSAGRTPPLRRQAAPPARRSEAQSPAAPAAGAEGIPGWGTDRPAARHRLRRASRPPGPVQNAPAPAQDAARPACRERRGQTPPRRTVPKTPRPAALPAHFL